MGDLRSEISDQTYSIVLYCCNKISYLFIVLHDITGNGTAVDRIHLHSVRCIQCTILILQISDLTKLCLASMCLEMLCKNLKFHLCRIFHKIYDRYIRMFFRILTAMVNL